MSNPVNSKRARRRVLVVTIGLLLVLELVHPFVWIGWPIKGKVLDAHSGAPIPRAVVEANWSLLGGLSDLPVAQLKVTEAVSDAQGQFVIPGWIAVHFGTAGVPGTAPEMWAFRRGYLPLNQHAPAWYRGAFPVIHLSEQIFRLSPADDSYERSVSGMTSLLVGNFTNDKCQLLHLPAFRAEVRAVSAELGSPAITSGIEAPQLAAACK